MHPGSSQNKALRLTAERILARRDHGREELRRKLLKRGFDAAAVGALITDLADAGLLDDGRYVESLKRFELDRGHGLNYIGAKLRQRGLRLERSQEDLRVEVLSLYRFMAKKGWVGQLLTQGPEGAKILRFLKGRGYTSAAIGAVLNGPPPDDPEREIRGS